MSEPSEQRETHIYTVSLELPECEGENPVQAVKDFQAQASQLHLFAYRVADDSTGETFLVDMADESVTPR